MTGQDVLALVALVVSLVALVATTLQVIQQYTATADGYRRCAPSIMGPWAKFTRRKFRPVELRFEVLFAAPVIFLAPPTNPYGPIQGRKIYYMDGSAKSYEETMTLQPRQQAEDDAKAKASVTTADDEKASWVTLLQSLQRQENDSRQWDLRRARTPRGRNYPPPVYTLSVGIQSKRRSWDFMPDSVTKPYATTTLEHLVEMTAMLGMSWKVFEDLRWNLRAEGNGILLLSYVLSGLGLMVTFSITGKSSFEKTRMIPSSDVKSLCFGSVPIIMDIQGISDMLEFGAGERVHHTLELLGVSRPNLEVYKKSRTHIFPIAFEVIGFFAKPLRLRGSNFTRIPNPTADPMPSESFSKTKLMALFMDKLQSLRNDNSVPASTQLSSIFHHWGKARDYWPSESEPDAFDIDLLEALHNFLDSLTTYLLTHRPNILVRIAALHLNAVLSSINELEDNLMELGANKEEIFVRHYFEIRARLESLQFRRSSHVQRDIERHGLQTGETEERNLIWCSLMCRMLAWLLLHSFGEVDRCIIPRDLKMSRMPVFIG